MNKNLEGYEWFKQGLKKEELLKAVKPAGKRQFILQNRSVKTHMNRFIILPSLYNRMIILGPVYMVSGGRANFSLISLKNSTNCLHENANSSRGGGGGGGGETTRVGELSRLGR